VFDTSYVFDRPVAWTRAGRHEPSREQPSSELAEHAALKDRALQEFAFPPGGRRVWHVRR
jgi:hypothetical protein